MTNSEKIKAYLDAGHKVRVEFDFSINIIYDHIEDKFIDVGGAISMSVFDEGICTIEILKQPIRYPNIGDKVVDLRDGKIYEVSEITDYCCIVLGGPIEIDYRHLTPYIE